MNIFELLSCCLKTYCPLLTLTRPDPDIITDPVTRSWWPGSSSGLLYRVWFY